MGSKIFHFDLKDLTGLSKNALLVGAAASLAYIIQNLNHLDLGAAGALIVPVISVGLDATLKWLKNNEQDETVESEKNDEVKE